MKKMTVLLSLLAVLVLGVSMAVASGPAKVIKEGGCWVQNTDETLFYTDNIHIVASNDTNKNTVLKCFATLPENKHPEKVMHFDGFQCNTYLGLTTNSKTVITPSGNVIMTCKINPSQ